MILGFVVSNNLPLKAQFLDDEFCGNREILNMDMRKKPWKGANQFLYDYLKQIHYSEDKDSIRYRVPVKFWIYQSEDGAISIADSTLKRWMQELNYYQELNHTGFRFYVCDVARINKKNKVTLGYYLEAPWQTLVHKDKACINVYVAQTIKKRFIGNKYMVRGTFNTITNSVLIQYNTSTTGLSHEIGHYFGLLHPHRNYNKGKSKQESVSRTRTFAGLFKKGLICEKNGDGLADTPAEPKLSYLVNNDCEFTGTSLKDRWGDNYQSATDNIMSYPTHYRCRKHFTQGQKAVMLYSASQNKYAKFWTTAIPENKMYCFDQYEPDNNYETASILDTGMVQYHTFHRLFVYKSSKPVFDQEDWLKFEVENRKGKELSIKLRVDDEDKSLKVKIYNEKMQLIKEEHIKGNQSNVVLDITTNLKSTYYILVRNMNSVEKQLLSYNISMDYL